MKRILLLLAVSITLFACGGNEDRGRVDITAPADSIPTGVRLPKKGHDIVGKEISYAADSIVMKGYIAYDKHVEGKRPGILVVHEWWGHNEHARQSADYLASIGYTALAVDMYGNGKQATHPSDAGTFSSAVMNDFEGAKKRFEAAITQLELHPTVEKDHLGAVGYCFGGGIVLNMARQGLDLDGVVSIHGSLGAVVEAEPGSVKARVLILTGSDDPFIPAEAREEFETEMQTAKVNYELITYEGVVHAFSNPEATAMGKTFDLPLAYDAKADSLSKMALASFFADIFE